MVMALNRDSLYALCRSCLKSGYIQELQPQYGDDVKPLPKPLSLSAVESLATSREEGEGGGSDDDKQEEKNIKDLSPSDLPKEHVKHAKRVQSRILPVLCRLSEKQLQRIARNKTRLALLLPPAAREQFKGDAVLLPSAA